MRGHDAGEQADPRGIAQRRSSIGARKADTFASKTVNVRRERTWMAIEMTNPMIQIINRQKEDVRGGLFG
jgi:hypothetical protein